MITVLGSINMDLIASTPRLPQPGETVSGTDFKTAPGGKGANQALAARRAGGTVLMCGAVGKDGFAEAALDLLTAAGVDLSQVSHTASPTGTALILVGGDGENMIAVIAGANGDISPAMAEMAVERMRKGDSLMMQMEISPAAIEAGIMAARAKGVRTILNIAPLTDEVERLAGLVDIVVANETEFERLSGSPAQSVARITEDMAALHAASGQTLIVTLGADGVVAMHEGQTLKIPALPVKPVDTVGAGDTFCGYLAQGLDAGLDFQAALSRAAIAGSLACLSHGAQPAIPTTVEVEAAIRSAPGAR